MYNKNNMKIQQLRQLIREEIENSTNQTQPVWVTRLIDPNDRDYIQIIYILTDNKKEAIKKAKDKADEGFTKVLGAEYLVKFNELDETEMEMFDEDGVAVFDPESR